MKKAKEVEREADSQMLLNMVCNFFNPANAAVRAQVPGVLADFDIDAATFQEMRWRADDPATPIRERRRLHREIAEVYSEAVERS